MGQTHFWFSAVPLTAPDENSDHWAVDNGLVSLTPLRLGLTDDEWLQKLWTEKESFILENELEQETTTRI